MSTSPQGSPQGSPQASPGASPGASPQIGLNARIRRLLFSPAQEWAVIAAEPGGVGALYRSYVAVLAAVPAIAGFIAAYAVGFDIPGHGVVRLGAGEALAAAALQYALSLGLVYVIARLAAALSPSFGGAGDQVAAFKLVAYSLTPAWLTGVFALLPGFGWLSVLGAYGVFLLYLGLPALMGVPRERAAVFTGALVTGTIVLSFLIALLMSVLAPLDIVGTAG